MTVEQMEIILKALAIALVAVFTMIIRPAIEKYVSQKDQEEIAYWIKVAIRCAEQLYTPEQWADKKAYVLNYITEKVNDMGLDYSAMDIENLIEGFVNEIKKG